jgi:hypothetical protein
VESRTMCRPVHVVLIALLVLNVRGFAADVTFDAASIKENSTPTNGGTLRRTPNGGVIAEHFALAPLITLAYGLQPFQLTGAPSWAAQTSYNINAKAPDGSSRHQMNEMLQALLVDRFHLSFHREMRAIDGVRGRDEHLQQRVDRAAENRERVRGLKSPRYGNLRDFEVVLPFDRHAVRISRAGRGSL